MAPEPLVLQGVREVGEEGWFGEEQRRWLGNCCEERAHVEFGVYCRCGGLGQIIDVITAIKPSYLVENVPDSKECSPHPYLNLSKTNDLFFYSLPLVIIGGQWRKKRMRRYVETLQALEEGSEVVHALNKTWEGRLV